MVSAEASTSTRRCQNSQMKDPVVLQNRCRYFARLLPADAQEEPSSLPFSSGIKVMKGNTAFALQEQLACEFSPVECEAVG